MINYLNRYTLSFSNANQQTRQIAGIGTSVVWIVILVTAVLVPTARGALEIQSQLQTANRYDQSLKENLDRINSIRKQLQDQATHLKMVETAIPANPHTTTLINELDLAVAVNNLVLEDLDYNRDTTTNTLPFTLRARGDYSSIRNLIEHIENHPRLIQITQLSIDRPPQRELARLGVSATGDSRVLSAIITGEAYTQNTVTTEQND